jgi:undecaprenyl-diphosphatase
MPAARIAFQSLLARLHDHDRALLLALVAAERSPLERRVWRALTHLGGATVAVLACALPLLVGAARLGAVTTAIVVASHLLVQLVKRTFGRPRPALGVGLTALVAEPDRFSFPSGHAAAAMALALGYATAAPAWLPALVALAVLVGVSRVALGVHYLGDVIAGQGLTVLAALLVRPYVG